MKIPSRIHSLQSVLKSIVLAGLAVALSTAAHAGLVVYEGFNYAGQADNAALNSGSFNGGAGLSGNWQGSGKYRSTGLTFSDLPVTGGCAQNSNSEIYYRPLSTSKTGTLWGSFLFKSVGVVDNSSTLLSYIVSKQANGNDWQLATNFGVTPKRYQGTNGDIRVGGNTANPTALSNSGGTIVTQGTTYLILFKVENLIASGAPTATSQTITSWILSEGQYDNFKSGGVTEAELNAATQGGGATNVMQKTTLTATQKASFSVSDYLTVQSNNAGDFMNDEFRFSDSSLAEVAPPAIPAANIVSFGSGATIGPVTASAAAISWTVPFGTNVTTLAPTYTLSIGATCDKSSGSTQNFTSPVHYIVTSSDSLFTTDYTVTVTVAPASTACDILTLGLPGGAGVIDQVSRTITLTVPGSPGVSSLSPTYSISPFATCSPVSGSTLNFTNPQSYTVTAQNGITQKIYTVRAQTYQAWAYSASLFILTTPDGANIPTGASEANFPLLLRLNKDSLDFSQVKAGGADLRFATASGVPMNYEIEQWDAVAKTAAIWICVPAITGNSRQEIKMYWGKSDAASESNGPAVFNATNGYCAVMHLNGNVLDATGSTSPVNNGATPTTAMIGSTAMNLATGGISADNITSFPTGTNPISSGEVWIRARKINSGWSVPLAWSNRGAYGWNAWIMQIGFWGSPTVLPAPLTCHGPGAVTGSTALAAQQWYHVSYTNSNGTATVYVNGVLDGTASWGSVTITNPQAMALGGDDLDVDEARISSVARSANWIKMAYENQKPLQTLVGNVVQTGNTLAVTPTSATLLEGASTTLTSQAGGAQKVYWIEKRNGVDTLLATDTFTLPITAGRVTGTQNYIIQFKAIYAASVQTVDIPITITEDLSDPVFTLTGPNTWDGRQTITVTPNISNLAALQAKGLANLTYTWSVSGVAAAKTISSGTPSVPGVMTLTRAQGSGSMTVTLVLHNGGEIVTQTKSITVTEPATDIYVVRTPGANEIPVTGQFYARDNSGLGKLYYNGTQSGTPTSVFLKVYTTDTGSDVLYATHTQSLLAGKYAFTAPIAPGLVNYKVVYGTTTNGVDTIVNTVSDLICGDAYIFQGQSNAVATQDLPSDITSNSWIRSYGHTTGGWGRAVRNGNDYTIGYFAYDLALSLTTTHNMPICIINGALGGKRIDEHQANPADHTAAGSLYSIYASLLNRVSGAKLTHGIRGIFWHQGENNSGAAAPTGDFDYKSYQQYFVDMSAAWKQDYPNFERYIVFQVMPKPCSMGPKGDQLRDVQRTLPQLYSKMDILNTLAVPGYLGCHFTAAGYENMADRTLPLVNQRYYGIVPTTPVTAPILKRAYFTSLARTSIALVFDQAMSWSNFSTVNYYVNDVGGKVTSGSASGNVVTLQLNSAAATTATLDYLNDNFWNSGESTSSLLYGANVIPALTFADVAIESASQSQTITFGALPTKTYGNAPFALTAAASSGLTVSYESSDPTVASISGTTATILKAGSTTITATQTGNGSFGVATPVAQLLTVNPASYSSWAGSPAQGLVLGVNDGPLADPDRDGILNLIEFTLGSAPMDSSQAILPKLAKSGGNLVFEYDRSDFSLAPATTQVVEYGSDLMGWTQVPIPTTSAGIVTITPGDSADRVQVNIPNQGNQLFVRLKVSK